ncbi:isoleucyl-tRNA synthetase [Thozetella sp. PMI_491]|nr:isoleucyl-tRNA synthetase [Thozetella sp. PMI_491]
MSKTSWTSTLRLPKSTFPPRPILQNRDQYIQRCADDLYKWQAANRPADNTFVLHDGPPYANGSLHAGHALNKILKDMILRVKVQQGHRVSYVPGWDCHGLPIELKAVNASAGKTMPSAEIRKAARALATKTVREQMASFRTYGVMAEWDRRWTTMDSDYEIKQLRLFQQMVRRGLIYRKFKPVYWSPSSRTALAEAELEYNEAHVSTAAYVRFLVAGKDGESSAGPQAEAYNKVLGGAEVEGNLYALIWTTTPWTLPANQIIAVHDDLDYCIVRHGKDAIILAEACLPRYREVVLVSEDPVEIINTVKGSDLTNLRYVNVVSGTLVPPQPFVHGSFVTADSGSGLVHGAPGHGFDDYLLCQSLGVGEVAAPVDGEGLFTADACPPNPDVLKGLSVQGAGNSAVLHHLRDHIIRVHKYTHKYPYDWRTKQPVIIRATAQWFADVASIKDLALAALDEVAYTPETGKNRLGSFVRGRSEWCISRQRAWGVPIPALYRSDEAVLTEESVEHIISVIQERGIDAWWSDPADDMAWVPPSLRQDGKGGAWRRGTDTMDVWFDSGSSWTQMDSHRQADVYLEGSDQHRGWFQSSLLTRVAAMAPESAASGMTGIGLAPYKELITHGFTLDEHGKKMSKSLGNTISADQVMDGSLLPPLKTRKKGPKKPVNDALGPDALRLWAASSDYTRDVILSETVLKSVHQSLIKYRTTVKMLTGSMQQSARKAPLTVLDRIALIQLKDVMEEVHKHYNNHEFNRVYSSLNRWLAGDLSAFYLEALKDRLYCADGGGVLEPIFLGFLRMLAPVTPLLVEEAWEHAPEWLKDDRSVLHPLQQLYTAPLMDPGRLVNDESELRGAIPILMEAHGSIKAILELARAEKLLGSSLGGSVVLEVPEGPALSTLEKYKDELEAIFVVSSVDLNTEVPADASWRYSQGFELAGSKCNVTVIPPREHKCPRCWRYVAPVEDELCGRCESVVGDGKSA